MLTSSTGAQLDPDLREFWERATKAAPATPQLSPRALEALWGGYYLTCLRDFEGFGRDDLERTLAGLAQHPITTGTLVSLARRGELERVARGRYRLSARAREQVEAQLGGGEGEAGQLDLSNLGAYLRQVPTGRKWRTVLVVIHFLREHCGVDEVDQHLLSTCFGRLRGVTKPGGLSSLLSQSLCKQRGLVERGSKRGRYRLTQAGLDLLRGDLGVAKADTALHSETEMARTG
ncbi:MAG: hypothetical protein R3F62_29535 [Planctomycetota bacterium]